MTAKEMFEKLGFEIDFINRHSIGYVKILHNSQKYITFNQSSK